MTTATITVSYRGKVEGRSLELRRTEALATDRRARLNYGMAEWQNGRIRGRSEECDVTLRARRLIRVESKDDSKAVGQQQQQQQQQLCMYRAPSFLHWLSERPAAQH